MASITYKLDGPKEFVFPHPVLYTSEIVLQQSPGTIVPPSQYRVIGAGPQSQSVTIRWPQAPVNGNSDLIIARYIEEGRIADFTKNGVDARSIDAEFDHIYSMLKEAKQISQTLIVPQGGWDASIGHFPNNASEGDIYRVTGAGTVSGISFDVGDRLIALVDNPDPNTYAGNWLKSIAEEGIQAGDPNTLLTNAANYVKSGEGNAQFQNTAGYLTSIGNIDYASTTKAGIVQQAADSQVEFGDANNVFVTPKQLRIAPAFYVLELGSESVTIDYTGIYNVVVVGAGGHGATSTSGVGAGGGSGEVSFGKQILQRGVQYTATFSGTVSFNGLSSSAGESPSTGVSVASYYNPSTGPRGANGYIVFGMSARGGSTSSGAIGGYGYGSGGAGGTDSVPPGSTGKPGHPGAVIIWKG